MCGVCMTLGWAAPAPAQQFCDQIRRIQAAAPDFMALRAEPLPGQNVGDIAFFLPGAVDCYVEPASPTNPPIYYCRWLESGAQHERALKEGHDLADNVRKCIGGDKKAGKEGTSDVVTLLPRGGFAAGKPNLVFKVITQAPKKRGGTVVQELYVYIAEAGTM